MPSACSTGFNQQISGVPYAKDAPPQSPSLLRRCSGSRRCKFARSSESFLFTKEHSYEFSDTAAG